MLLIQTVVIISFGAVSAFNARIKSPSQWTSPLRTKNMVFEHSEGEQALTRRTALAISLTPALIAYFALSSPVDAIEGPLSILAGRSASMLHPITNLALFGAVLFIVHSCDNYCQEHRYTPLTLGFNGEDFVRLARKSNLSIKNCRNFPQAWLRVPYLR